MFLENWSTFGIVVGKSRVSCIFDLWYIMLLCLSSVMHGNLNHRYFEFDMALEV